MIPIGLALAPPASDVPNALDDLVARARSAAGAGMASLWLGQVYDIDANPWGFTTPEEHARTVEFLGSLSSS